VRVLLFKASGRTYRRVLRLERHAFPYSPNEVRRDELVVLSKNREDCAPTEAQIQHLAKLSRVEAASPEELQADFEGVRAAERWRYRAFLYWSSPLQRPFNLSQVEGLNYQRYSTVQNFARFDAEDAMALLLYLDETNPRVVLDFINRAAAPEH
jgi:hypothetical protein